MSALRHEYLVRQLQALQTRVRMLSGAKLSFDEESAALYDATAPAHPESYFQATLDELDRRLPPGGTLNERYGAFRQDFVDGLLGDTIGDGFIDGFDRRIQRALD